MARSAHVCPDAPTYRPSVKTIRTSAPVLALGALALVATSTTAGWAGGQIGGAGIRNGSLTSVDIRNGSIQGVDLNPGLRQDLAIGRAYATVVRKDGPGGTVVHALDKKRTSGFVKVYQGLDDSEPVTGIWCLVPAKGVDLSRSPILTTTEYGLSAGVGIDALWSAVPYTCDEGDIEIHTVQWLGDDEPSPSDDVAFQVFAP